MGGRGPIRVTAEDLTTGDIETVEVMDEYVLICAGTCHVSYQQVFRDGTVQLTIKGRQLNTRAEWGEGSYDRYRLEGP